MAKKFRFRSEKGKEKINIFSSTDEIIDTDIIRGPHIEMFSNREIVIDGCQGVYEYSEEYLKLNIGKGALMICGCNFDIVALENRTITVKGKISSLEFCV